MTFGNLNFVAYAEAHGAEGGADQLFRKHASPG
jgi:hypothetical protein